AYEEVFAMGDRSPSYRYLVAAEWFLDPGTAAVFESSRKELFALRQKQTDTGLIVLGRLMGSPFKYVAANFLPDRESGRTFLASAPFVEYQRAHPHTEYASVRRVIEGYEVLRLDEHA